MNFLELCQDLAREAGISGSIVSVTGQTGEAARIVNWIIKAYRFVQAKHVDWKFLRADVAFDTNGSSDTYTAAAAGVAGFGEWRFAGDDWRCWRKDLGAADEQPVRYVDYDDFCRMYSYGANRLVTGRPQFMTERPDQSLQFWPVPDASYTIIGEHFRAPITLAKNDDVPIFSAKFHEAIVQRGLMLYGLFEGDASVHAGAQSEFNRWLSQMESIYLPDIEPSGPMA